MLWQRIWGSNPLYLLRDFARFLLTFPDSARYCALSKITTLQNRGVLAASVREWPDYGAAGRVRICPKIPGTIRGVKKLDIANGLLA